MMRWDLGPMAIAASFLLGLVLFVPMGSGGPLTVDSAITIPGDNPITLRGNQTTSLDMEGFFIVSDIPPPILDDFTP